MSQSSDNHQQGLQARTVGFKPGERNVFFHLLTACNLKCEHCYINREQHGSQQVSLQEAVEWLNTFASSALKSNLILLGGEPTLHPELVQIVAAAKKLGFAVTVDSNGYLFHDFLERISPQQLDYLSFSLDGSTAEVNDAIRGQNVYNVCTANIKKAVAKGLRVSLIYTVSKKNVGDLKNMPALLSELGVKKFFIQVIGLRGNSAKPQAHEGWQVSREEWLAVVPKVAREAAQRGIQVTYPKVFLEGDEIFECAGNVAENYFIFPNGRVYQCPLCEDHPIHGYHLQDGQLVRTGGLTELDFFRLDIPEGCVMNKLLQPETLEYDEDGRPCHRISCCLLKQEIG